MRALVMTAPLSMEVQDWTPPILPDKGDYVSLRVHSCGICGSDMHAYHGHDTRRVPPIVLGHEVVGYHQDQAYAVNPLIECGQCPQCQQGRVHLCPYRQMVGMQFSGGFAEEIVVRRDKLFAIPETLSMSNAVLAEPLACAVHAVRLVQQQRTLGLTTLPILVIGGGAIGLLIAMVLLDAGATAVTIVEAHAERAQRLTTLMPDIAVITPEQCVSYQHAFDIVFDAVGSGKTRAAASDLVQPGGVMLHIGLQDNAGGLDTRYMTLQEVTFLGCYCYDQQDFAAAMTLLSAQRVTPTGWCDYRLLEDGASAFTELHQGSMWQKIVLEV